MTISFTSVVASARSYFLIRFIISARSGRSAWNRRSFIDRGLSELEGLPEVDGLPDVDGLPEVDGLWSVSGRGREVFPGRPDVLGRDVVPGRPEVPGRVGALCGRTEVFGRKRTEPKSERR